jgi:hypothetical protein
MKKFILLIAAIFSLTLSPFIALPAYADCPDASTPQGQALQGVGQVGNCNSSGVDNFVRTIVNVISVVVGIAAIIVIIMSGFKYITSGGDSGKVSSAKNTLIYALIGIAIAALSQVIVRVVLTETNKSTLPVCAANQDPSKDNCR